jgi:GcrA cell cycle regulator
MREARALRDQAWTSEQLKLLKDLWANGETAAAIGARLGGLTRSAVLGKVFRLRLKADFVALPAAPPAGVRHGDQEAAASATYRAAAPKRRRRSPVRADRLDQQIPAANRQPQATPPVKRRGKSLLELTNHSCRWPHGRPGTKTFFFCGADEADLERGMPYCPLHTQRAYVAGAGSAKANSAAVTWSTLRAIFAPDSTTPRQPIAANGSRP